MEDLLTGLALAMVIEGILYAAFPQQAKAMMKYVLASPPSSLRAGGLFLLVVGVVIVWLIRG